MNDEPPDIRLSKSDRTAARTDSKGMTMALNDRYSAWALCRANRHLAPAPAINLREVQQTIAAVDEAIKEAELRNEG
jgi:hypothetical protein